MLLTFSAGFGVENVLNYCCIEFCASHFISASPHLESPVRHIQFYGNLYRLKSSQMPCVSRKILECRVQPVQHGARCPNFPCSAQNGVFEYCTAQCGILTDSGRFSVETPREAGLGSLQVHENLGEDVVLAKCV